MDVLRLHGPADLRLHDEPASIPAINEYSLRITAVGICGSDLRWLERAGIGDEQLTTPLVLGHEFAATIDAGSHCGKQVAVDPAIICRRCRYCEEGNANFCDALRFAGTGKVDGALRERLNWPKSHVYFLPDGLTHIEGAMLEPLGVALHAFDLGKMRPGMAVGIFGCGPIGLLLVQLARIAGATRIIATDKLVHRLEAAKVLGATVTIMTCNGREYKDVWAAADHSGIDLAFEAAGENEAIETAIKTTRPGGQVILIGIPEDDRTAFTASIARRKGLTIKLVRRMKRYTYPRAIHLVQHGLVELGSLVTHRFPLSAFKEAFATAKSREGIKVIIEP